MDRLLCLNDRRRSQVFTVEQRSAAAISAIDRGDSRCTAQLGGSPIVDVETTHNQTVSTVKRSAGATLQGATRAAVEIAYSVAQRQQMSAAVTEIPARRAGGRFALELADQSFAPHLLVSAWWAPPAASHFGDYPFIQRRLMGEFFRNKIHKRLRSL
jgi:hypothetical protein